MNISSVNSSPPIHATGRSEAVEVAGAADHDGDRDDGGPAASASAPQRPSVNLSGQTVGRFLSVKA